MCNITRQYFLLHLKPQYCAYSISKCDGIIETPQNDKWLKEIKKNTSYCGLKVICNQEDKNIDYNKLATWSNNNNHLFLTDDKCFLFRLPKFIFSEKR